ncbi:MAG TPA: hypothetical protein VNV43_08115 [Candidatus Acidoferrales bacterium]|jgi:hypothetical protein|nr:hypothetical protein [Candidatus Acidoferrales bacterium]
MSFATTATIIGVVGAAGSLAETGYALAGGNQPQYPNEAASSAQMAQTNAALLPIQRGLAAAAQTGGKYTFNLPQGASAASLGIQNIGGGWYDGNGKLVSTDPNYAAWFGGSNRGIAGATPYQWRPGTMSINGIPIKQNGDGSYTIDFNGYGTAQAAATEAQQNAASQLALQQQYDPKFIAQALQEEQQADPQSVAARTEMGNLTQQQANAPLNEPVSTMLNSQIQDALNAAQNNSLTPTDTARLNAAVSDALGSRGVAAPNPSLTVGAQLTSGFPGEQRQSQAAQSALGFLGSGSDPEDIAYRRTQQNLANLAAEANGQTPSSQFASLSGASSGPAPMSQGATLPLLSDNGAAAQQIGLQNWETQMQNANNQVNPWMVGLSGMLNLGSSLAPRTATPSLLTPQNPAS